MQCASLTHDVECQSMYLLFAQCTNSFFHLDNKELILPRLLPKNVTHAILLLYTFNNLLLEGKIANQSKTN